MCVAATAKRRRKQAKFGKKARRFAQRKPDRLKGRKK